MAEVKTAPTPKGKAKVAAKAAKPTKTVQAKPELSGSMDTQPLLMNRPPISATSTQGSASTPAKGLWQNSVQTKPKVDAGASTTTAISDQPEESSQAKPEKASKDNLQASATVPPPASGSSSGGSNGNLGTPTDNSGASSNTDSNTAKGTGNHNQKPDAIAEQGLQKENPITRRAASYKEEPIAQVKALGLEGNSEQTMLSFTGAKASQIGATYPSMGNTLNQKLGSEKEAASQDAPKLTAGMGGVKDQKVKPTSLPGTAKDAQLNDGITEGEPAAPKAVPFQTGSGFKHQSSSNLKNLKPPEEESGGLFSWLFGAFKKVLVSVPTVDPGLNTSAGPAPKINATGKANPQRSENLTAESKGQAGSVHRETTNAIRQNPGQENIQPLYFEESFDMVLDTKVNAQVVTGEDQAMGQYIDMELPESVRGQADLDLAPVMEQSLSKPRQETKSAVNKRDTEKEAAISNSETKAEELNQSAEDEQNMVVSVQRAAIAEKQRQSIQKADMQMNAFSTEADQKKAKANKEVNDRIKQDESKADKELRNAEKKAEQEKINAEKKAAEEKKKAEKDSENDGFWSKVGKAISAAFDFVVGLVKKVFELASKVISAIIDLAANIAIAIIEVGRKWIVDALDALGDWLKAQATILLKNYPELQKQVIGYIDEKIDGAKKSVNAMADKLKKGVRALADALKSAINSILSVFETLITGALQIAGALLTGDFQKAAKIAFMSICKVAGIDPQPILDFIKRAGKTIGIIFNDLPGFFRNVAGGVKLGMSQFTTHIKKHLMNGLIGWLTGAMSDVPIEMPKKFDLKGVFSLVTQIMGLTYAHIRAKVVKRIGPKGEDAVIGMEKTFQFIKDLVLKGPIVLYERIQDKFEEVKQLAMDKIRNLISFEVVKAGIKWLIGLLNPVSAIVKAVIMLYDFVMFLIERKDQVIAFVTAIYDTVAPLALGKLKKAGNAVEGAMGRGVPVMLGLFANLIGLGGIGKSVSKVIKTIQKPVDKVVDPVINWLVDKGKKLYGKGKAVAKNVKDKVMTWLNIKKVFKTKDGQSHKVYFANQTLMVASTPMTLNDIIQQRKKNVPKLPPADVTKLLSSQKRLNTIKDGKDTPAVKTTKIDAEMLKVVNVLAVHSLDDDGMHKPKGTKTDPVYINWYKDPSDYAQIVIWKKGATKSVPLTVNNSFNKILDKPLNFDKRNFKKAGNIVKRIAAGDRNSKFRSWAANLRGSTTRDFEVTEASNPAVLLDLGSKLANSWQLDHVRSLRVGGPDKHTNLWPISSENNGKANNMLSQYIIYQGKAELLSKLPSGVYIKASKKTSVTTNHGTKLNTPFKGDTGETQSVNKQLAGPGPKNQIRTGTASDPIPVIWNKIASDFPTLHGKSIKQKVMLDKTKNLYLQVNSNYLDPKTKWQLNHNTNRTVASNFRTEIVATANAETAKNKQTGSTTKDKQVEDGNKVMVSGKPLDQYVAFDHVKDHAFEGADEWSNIWVMREDKNQLAQSNNLQYVALHGEKKALSVRNKKLLNKYMKIVRQTSAKDHGSSPENPTAKEELTKFK